MHNVKRTCGSFTMHQQLNKNTNHLPAPNRSKIASKDADIFTARPPTSLEAAYKQAVCEVIPGHQLAGKQLQSRINGFCKVWLLIGMLACYCSLEKT